MEMSSHETEYTLKCDLALSWLPVLGGGMIYIVLFEKIIILNKQTT